MFIQMKYLKLQKSGIYSFRRRVPTELQSVIGKKEFKYSLDTRDLPKAIQLTHKYTSETDLEIQRAKQRLETSQKTSLSFHSAQVMAHKWAVSEQKRLDNAGQLSDYREWLVKLPDRWESFSALGLLESDHLTEHAKRILPHHIDSELTKHRLAFTPESNEYQTLLTTFNLAAMNISQYCLARTEHRQYAIDTSLASSELHLQGNKYRLSQLFAKYHDEKSATGAVREATLKETQSQVNDFILEYGDTDVRDVNREMVGEYGSLLLKQPKTKSKKLRTLTLTERASLAASEGLELLNKATIKNKVKKLSPIFSYAIDLGIIDSNPFDRQAKRLGAAKEQSEKIDYSETEIERIFSHSLFKEGPDENLRKRFGMAAYWFPILSYYTGARREEICQLRKEDFEFDSECPFIMIHDKHEKQTVKTRSSIRRVPIHPHLIYIGLKEYVDSTDDFIFPALLSETQKMGNNIGKWWGSFIRSLNIQIAQPSHGFRHTFISLCRKSGISEADQEWITGHRAQKVSRRYGSSSIDSLAKSITSIPELILKKITLK